MGFPVLQPREGQESGGKGWSCTVPGPGWLRKRKSQGLSSGPRPSPLVEGASGLEWRTLERGLGSLLDVGRPILALSESKLRVDEAQDLSILAPFHPSSFSGK